MAPRTDIGIGNASVPGLTPEDAARAGAWRLIARLLSAPPGAAFLGQLATMRGDDTPVGRALSALAARAAVTTPAAADDEYHDLFIGITRGELLPFGSYYQTGFLNEKPLARLREDMARLGLMRAGTADPEDHVAALADMLAAILLGEADVDAPLAAAARFYRDHMDSWIDVFFADLEQAGSARLYAPVGALGLALVEIERALLVMQGEEAAATPPAGV